MLIGITLNVKGFKDTATHDFMFKASRTDADSLSVSMKSVVLMSQYVRVCFLFCNCVCDYVKKIFLVVVKSIELVKGSGLA